MNLNVSTCPRCNSPVTGITCSNCGLNVETAETVRCHDCGDTVLEDDATEHRYQKPVTAQYRTVYYCSDCN